MPVWVLSAAASLAAGRLGAPQELLAEPGGQQRPGHACHGQGDLTEQ
jgi:hypothetical protein